MFSCAVAGVSDAAWRKAFLEYTITLLLQNKLSYLEDSNLRFALKQKNPDLVDGTIIKLKLEEINHKPASILNDFNRLIGLLLIFSKKIKTYKFFEERQDFSYTWSPNFWQADQSIEIGTVRINQGTIRVLCFKLGNIGHFLISLNFQNLILRLHKENFLLNYAAFTINYVKITF